MKKMSIMILIALFVLVVSCKREATIPPELVPSSRVAKEYREVTKRDINLKWKVDGNHLKIIVRAPTDGWIAVGFNPKHHMQDANIIIGYVKDGNIFMRDDWGSGHTAHQADKALGGLDNLTDKSGREVDGFTEISFTIPLDSGDAYDQVLVPGQKCKVILAYGRKGADNFTSFHKRATTVEITL